MSTELPPVPGPEVLALLAEARDRPEEDGPRLVLADYLMEHGDPAEQARGEFIRLQVLSERLPEGDRGRVPLVRRAHELR